MDEIQGTRRENQRVFGQDCFSKKQRSRYQAYSYRSSLPVVFSNGKLGNCCLPQGQLNKKMETNKPTDAQLRSQIEVASATQYPAQPIEERIAASLLESGRFQGNLNAKELALILRNLVYTIFTEQHFGGRDVKLVHNIPSMKVSINKHQADVNFLVHIHKPIVAFLTFSYSLLNDPVSAGRNLRIKHGSLKIKQDTRRFDVKAKAALAAIDVDGLAQRELSDPAAIILATLPQQLQKRGARGEVKSIDLFLHDESLEVCLEGEFESGLDQ